MTPEQTSILCPDCKEALAKLAKANQPTLVRGIVDEVSIALNVPAADILGTSRRRPVAHARQVVMMLARKEGRSLCEIGHVLKRDHTTILHGSRAAEKRLENL